MKTGAIIVAAGSSSRMNGENKILIKIDGIEVIAKTLINFEKTKLVDYIIVVTREDMICAITEIGKKYGISKVTSIVKGGATRQESVGCGIAVCPDDTDIIAIHDGARPFADEDLITGTINDCIEYGAAMPGVPVKETIKKVEDNFIESTPERSKLYIAQTPQVFDFKHYKEAFKIAQKDSLDFTDDCQLIEHIGKKVYISKGAYKNIKITTKEDIILANAMGGI